MNGQNVAKDHSKKIATLVKQNKDLMSNNRTAASKIGD